MIQPQYSDDDLVKRFIELRNFLKAEDERQSEFTKPYRDGMATIQNMLHQRLLERGAKEGEKAGGSTEHGTFFFKNTLSVKVADREAWFDFIIDVPLDEGEENEERTMGYNDGITEAVAVIKQRIVTFLTAHVAKEAVEAYVTTHQAPPPGVDIQTLTQVQVRSA